MQHRELVFFSAIVLLGFLDWLTTTTGIVFFGATEVNPLLGGLAGSSMLLFSLVKLSTVVCTGLAFYKAAAISSTPTSDWQYTKRFLNAGYLATFLALTAVVINNVTTIF